jgi:glycosyltransferase involved in cell wall biosynthesis
MWWEKISLPRQVREDGCNIFLSPYQNSAVFHPYMNVKHLMVVHDIIPKIFPEYLDNARKELYWRLTERGIRRSDHIIAVSKRTEKDLIEYLGIKGGKITVSHIDADEDFKKKPTKEKIGKVLRKYKLKPGYILAGGGMEIRKNIEGVIRAYKILSDKNKNLRFIPELPKLVIYGKLAPDLSLAFDAEKLVRDLNLTKQVKFLGAVPGENLPAVFSQSSLFVYPSFYEGFGLPPLEAMRQGIPAIVSKKSSLPEICSDAALYCDADDPHDIAMVMKNVLTNKNLRETLSQRGRQRSGKFSWTKFVKKVMNILDHKNSL